MRELADVPPVQAEFVSLHIKALVGDRKRCFIGSLNLDPRALLINTENGLYIESEPLCGRVAESFDLLMQPQNAWQVSRNNRNLLVWEAGDERVTIQPARSFWQHFSDFFYQLLPLESQL